MLNKDLKLLGLWTSPFVNRVEFAFNLKGITDYEFVAEKLSNKSDLLLKSNPVHKKIPVLIHHGKPVCESLVIMEYIDELWSSGYSILPADPHDRATARFWAACIDDKLFLALKKLRFSDSTSSAELMEELAELMAQYEDAFLKISKGKDYFGGDDVGFLDLVLSSYLSWIKAIEALINGTILDRTKTPNLAKWADKFAVHDAVQGTLPTPEKLIKFHYDLAAETASAASSQASK